LFLLKERQERWAKGTRFKAKGYFESCFAANTFFNFLNFLYAKGKSPATHLRMARLFVLVANPAKSLAGGKVQRCIIGCGAGTFSICLSSFFGMSAIYRMNDSLSYPLSL
jgi:hypothetical protein